MTVVRLRRDLTDYLLALIAIGLVAGFTIYALPSLLSIFSGTFREMSMPDGSQITFSSDVQGMVGLARRAGDIELTGWAYDRRIPDRNVLIDVFVQGRLVQRGITDLEEEDIGRDAGLKVATPRFVLHFPAVLAPSDPNEPIRVFAIGKSGEGREIFKGGRPVHIVEDTVPRTTK